jgi:hypothetical protein
MNIPYPDIQGCFAVSWSIRPLNSSITSGRKEHMVSCGLQLYKMMGPSCGFFCGHGKPVPW